MQLEQNIGELLYCHDCVIVPEFGGFVVNYRSAWVDELRNTIHPPSKEISFNKKLVRNDGLLADHVAQIENIPFDEANALIADHVKAWDTQLKNGERVEIKGVGGLFLDQVKNLQFDPDIRHNYLTSAFGMTAVQLPQVIDQTVVEQAKSKVEVLPLKVVQSESLSKPEHEEHSTRKVSFIPAAAAAIALLIAFGFWLNTRTNVLQDGMAQFSGMNPFKDSVQLLYKQRALEDLNIEEIEDRKLGRADDVEYFKYSFLEHAEHDNGRVIEWTKPKPAEAVNTFVKTVEKNERFHVVGGCFSIEENAIGLIDKLKADGYDPRLIDQHKGLYRVSVGSYINRQQALRALAAVRKEHTPSAWLLVK